MEDKRALLILSEPIRLYPFKSDRLLIHNVL